MEYCVIIRGPAGGGKTTIAKELARNLNAYYLSFDELMAAYMDLPPNKMLYVDDKLQNVEAAIADAGVARGVLISPAQPLALPGNRKDVQGRIIVATYGTFEKALRDDCGLRF